MQTPQKKSGMAIIAAIVTLIVAGTDAQKFHSCCTEVSRTELSGPITGYRLQKRDPPCVQAVIFETEQGEFCIHVKQAWVLRKIRQFERSRKTKVSTTSFPEYSTGTTVSTRELTASSQSFPATENNLLNGQTAEVTSPANEQRHTSHTVDNSVTFQSKQQ